MEYMAKPKPGQNPAAGAHGGGVRGDQVNRGSRMFEGRFGRMFRTLPAAEFDSDALEALAKEISAPPETDPNDPKKPAASEEKPGESFHDGEENTGIPAGYTYLGQFIDHDITFDPASSLQKQNDPDGLINFRTPALDLDCVYGRGPDDQPYMYDAEGKTFLLGDPLTYTVGGTPKTFDLLRVGEKNRAVIGDKRNDENVIVSQLQGAFLQFHNRLVKENPTLSFKEIQRKVRWHYQYVVLNDYLPRIVGDETMQKVWPGWKNGNTCDNKPKLCFYHFHGSAYMPIEFSAAAYRFGHSMVRPIYRLNTLHDQSITGEHPGLAGRFFIFAGVQKRGLNGFGKFPSNWAIDWSLYFDINGSSARVGKERVQPAYKIDASMVNPLAFLPEFSKPPIPFTANTPMEVKDLQSKEVNHKSPNNLATRNLWRGNSMGLPSGQDVARAMGEEALKESELFVGKAQLKDDGSVDEKPLSTVENNYFAGNAPLWYYVLAEANAQWRKNKGSKKGDDANKVSVTLGPVGGRIVAETLIGLLLADSHSYLNQYPLWKPTSPIAPNGKPFTMGDFIKYALNL